RDADGGGRRNGDGRLRLQEGENPLVLAAADRPDVDLLTFGPAHQVERAVRDARPVERAAIVRDEEHRADEPEVADAVRDERLLPGLGVRLVLVPEPDEEVRAEADALPPDEEDGEVVAQNED